MAGCWRGSVREVYTNIIVEDSLLLRALVVNVHWFKCIDIESLGLKCGGGIWFKFVRIK